MGKALLFGSIMLVFGLNQAALGIEAGGACAKDGKAFEVKGDSDKAKQESCEAAKGKWTPEKKEAVKAEKKEKKEKSAGGGGGW